MKKVTLIVVEIVTVFLLFYRRAKCAAINEDAGAKLTQLLFYCLTQYQYIQRFNASFNAARIGFA